MTNYTHSVPTKRDVYRKIFVWMQSGGTVALNSAPPPALDILTPKSKRLLHWIDVLHTQYRNYCHRSQPSGMQNHGNWNTGTTNSGDRADSNFRPGIAQRNRIFIRTTVGVSNLAYCWHFIYSGFPRIYWRVRTCLYLYMCKNVTGLIISICSVTYITVESNHMFTSLAHQSEKFTSST